MMLNHDQIARSARNAKTVTLRNFVTSGLLHLQIMYKWAEQFEREIQVREHEAIEKRKKEERDQRERQEQQRLRERQAQSNATTQRLLEQSNRAKAAVPGGSKTTGAGSLRARIAAISAAVQQPTPHVGGSKK